MNVAFRVAACPCEDGRFFLVSSVKCHFFARQFCIFAIEFGRRQLQLTFWSHARRICAGATADKSMLDKMAGVRNK